MFVNYNKNVKFKGFDFQFFFFLMSFSTKTKRTSGDAEALLEIIQTLLTRVRAITVKE